MKPNIDPIEFTPPITAAITAFITAIITAASTPAVDQAFRRIQAEKLTDESGQILVNKQQAGEVLSVSTSTVDRWRREAGLPCVKIDGLVLFRPESLQKWAAAREEVAT